MIQLLLLLIHLKLKTAFPNGRYCWHVMQNGKRSIIFKIKISHYPVGKSLNVENILILNIGFL